MNRFLNEMGDRLAADNLFVYGISNIREFRDIHLDGKGREMSNKFSLMAFMLVNVFFGIIGTFWLRAQNRRGEIGLRMALGAYDGTLRRYLYLEGLCLLALTLPFIALFAINMVATDAIDTYRLPFTTGRFAISFGITYLMMSGMICLGIWLPVRKVTRWSRRRRCITNKLSIFASVNLLMRKEQAYDSYRIKNVVTARGDVFGG